MEQYLRWYVKLAPFYKILILASLLVGSLALLTGMATENPVFFLLGLVWLAGGPVLVWVISGFEDNED